MKRTWDFTPLVHWTRFAFGVQFPTRDYLMFVIWFGPFTLIIDGGLW
jgi:hypothetical protein